MNAPATIAAPEPLDTLMPWVKGEERELRISIRKARDIATARVAHLETPSGRTLNWLIVDMATAYIYAPATVETLRDVREQALRLLHASRAAERLEEPANGRA